MKRLQKLALNKGLKMTDHQMKRIFGGYDGSLGCTAKCNQDDSSTFVSVKDCSKDTVREACKTITPNTICVGGTGCSSSI